MAANCQFAFATHVLAMLALQCGQELTSSALAASVSTNPVVIRRLLAHLQRAGLLLSRKDAGSGSRLRRAPELIGLDEVFRATAPATSMALHSQNPSACCPVGGQIEGVLGDIIGSAWGSFERELAKYTLADVLSELRKRSADDSMTPSARSVASLVDASDL